MRQFAKCYPDKLGEALPWCPAASQDLCQGGTQGLEELRSPKLRFENLALRARAMTKRQTSHRPGKQFDQNDIIRLLRAAVEREGGQTAFAQRHRVHRSSVNRVLKGKLPVGDAIAKVLKLRRVYVAY